MLDLKERWREMERGKRGRSRSRVAAAAVRGERVAGDRRIPSFDPTRLRALGLSRRELAVLELVGQGRTNEEIAVRLELSPLTVKKHLERMYGKLGASNRAALVAVAWQRSRLPGPPASLTRRRATGK